MAARRLPDSITPMLATSGKPFDSDRHVFEPKWDGLRCLVFVDDEAVRMIGRRGRVMTARYPELAELSRFPAGSLIDGEVVAFRDGMPNFALVLRRELGRGTEWATHLAQEIPAHYMAFDLLYEEYEPMFDTPLTERRQRLAAMFERMEAAAELNRVVRTDGVVGAGKRYYREACDRGLEGVVAKRLDSTYSPGRRSGAWVKIKRIQELNCVVIGYLPKEDAHDFRALLVAANDADGQLHFVGRPGSGLSDDRRRRVMAELDKNRCQAPIVPCPDDGIWVEPVIFCTVRFSEKTAVGLLRNPRLHSVELP